MEDYPNLPTKDRSFTVYYQVNSIFHEYEVQLTIVFPLYFNL